jgi:hypothetical protein
MMTKTIDLRAYKHPATEINRVVDLAGPDWVVVAVVPTLFYLDGDSPRRYRLAGAEVVFQRKAATSQ